MNKHQFTLLQFLYGILIVVALLIVIDFMLPGSVVKDEIKEVKRERQQYYNAAQNSHFSYTVVAGKHQFFVAEDFATSIQDHKQIEYSVSRIFKEINWARLFPSGDRAIYSLRIMSGLVLPLLAIGSILVASRLQKNLDTLVFVCQVLLIADLVYVMT